MESVRTRGSRQVWIRPIEPSDAEAIGKAYERLSPRSQYQRFLAPKPRLSAAELCYLTEIDGHDHYALLVTAAGVTDRILGVGRFVRLSDDRDAAEFAIVVGDPFQNEGIGSELAERLAVAARERGITRFTATILADNQPAHRLVHRLAAGGLEPDVDAVAVATERHCGAVDEVEIVMAA